MLHEFQPGDMVGSREEMREGAGSLCAQPRPPAPDTAYRIIESSQEVDFIHQGIHFGLQLHLVHVGGVHVLGTEHAFTLRFIPGAAASLSGRELGWRMSAPRDESVSLFQALEWNLQGGEDHVGTRAVRECSPVH